jgi:ribonucleoside-diphosphate reductase alpha chain
MTGHACHQRTHRGSHKPFAGFADNAEPMLNVLRMHRAEAAKIDEELVPPALLGAAQRLTTFVSTGETFGVRNVQAMLAPTGTIGSWRTATPPVCGARPRAHYEEARRWRHDVHRHQTILRSAQPDYSDEQVDAIIAHIDEHKTIMGAGVQPEHLPVFAARWATTRSTTWPSR